VTSERALSVSETLAELAAADDPPPDIEPYLARFGSAGVTSLKVLWDPPGWRREVGGGVAAIGQPVTIAAATYDVLILTEVEWDASDAPITRTLDELATALQRFDRVRRLRHAATDMRLVAETADAFVDAHENDGPARLYERALETGMVVT
jgi:hypothetical protein